MAKSKLVNLTPKPKTKAAVENNLPIPKPERGVSSRSSAFKSPRTGKSTTNKSSSGRASRTSTSKSSSGGFTYNPPQFNASPQYNEALYRKGLDTSFYTKSAKQFAAQANKQRQAQIGEAKKQRQNALQQAYLNRAQNQLSLNNNMAMAGIRGGATETANLGLANQYGTAVSAANTDYANSVNTINQNINQSIFDYQQDMAARAEEYRQNQANARWQAAREDYANRVNAKREDYANRINIQREEKNNAYQRKQAETQRQTEYWSNYYINKYSGYSKKKLKAEEKAVKVKLKNAKTAYEKIRWQQALSGLGARRGVIENK